MCKGTAVADKASRAELLSWPARYACSPHLSLVREVTQPGAWRQGGLALSQLALQLPGRWVLQSTALQQSLPWAEALVFGEGLASLLDQLGSLKTCSRSLGY